MRTIAAALCVVAVHAWAAPDPVLARLCADDPRKSGAAAPLRNEHKKTVGKLLGIVPGSGVDARVHEILAARPLALSPFINWAEGVDPSAPRLKIDVGSARIEAAGYQTCIRDARGSYWYFRNVPGDLWVQ